MEKRKRKWEKRTLFKDPDTRYKAIDDLPNNKDHHLDIIIDSGKAVFLVFDDIELFMEDYFGEAECFSIDILNRDIKKWIIIYKTEYYLEYFNQDV